MWIFIEYEKQDARKKELVKSNTIKKQVEK